MSVLITSVLNCASDRLAISSSLSCIFSGALKCSVIWAFFFFFFLSCHVCYFKGRSLRCSPGRGNAGRCAVMLYVGEGPRGSNSARSTLHWISVIASGTHNQIGPLWCWFPSGWACARPRPLLVSPTTSPVRLGVSPAAIPTLTGVFNQRFEALFPRAGALGCAVCFAPRHSSRFICARMWGHGLLPAALPALFSATRSPALWVYLCKCGAAGSASGQSLPVSVPPWQLESSPPWLPVSAPPTGLDECLFFISLVSDFLAV